MADPVREPLYTPNRVYPRRQAEPTQNGLQTFFFGTVASPPFVNTDFGRPCALAFRREDVAQRRFAFNTPFVTADFGKPKTALSKSRDDVLGSNELLFVGVAPSVFIAQFDASGPAKNLWTRADTPLGTPLKLLAQIVQIPVAQSDLSARAQSPYRRIDVQLGISYQVQFPARPFTRSDLSAPAPNRYRRVDGPIGSPLALAFPAPISVLPRNVFDVATRPINLRVTGQDVAPVNLQMARGLSILETIPYLIGAEEYSARIMLGSIYMLVVVVGSGGVVTAQSVAPFTLAARGTTVTITMGGSTYTPSRGGGNLPYNLH